MAECEHPSVSFDRSVCACGSMHDYCDDCGVALDCPYVRPSDEELTRPLDDPGGVTLEIHRFEALVRVPKRVWSVTFPETGETWECRKLRKLLWNVYAPGWIIRLRWAVADAWWRLRYPDPFHRGEDD